MSPRDEALDMVLQARDEALRMDRGLLAPVQLARAAVELLNRAVTAGTLAQAAALLLLAAELELLRSAD